MRAAICFLAVFVVAQARPAVADAREDYVLLTAHIDASMIHKRSAEGRVLEFVDVLGRKNRCTYDEDGRIREIHYSSVAGDFKVRFTHDKRGELTSMKLADGTIVLFRGGRMMPSTGKASLAENFAAALEHWLAKSNAGL